MSTDTNLSALASIVAGILTRESTALDNRDGIVARQRTSHDMAVDAAEAMVQNERTALAVDVVSFNTLAATLGIPTI